jgi:hypothetical protein
MLVVVGVVYAVAATLTVVALVYPRYEEQNG